MMRGSDSTTARSSTRPPMVAGPTLRNFRFFRTASCVVWAMALPVNRANNTRGLADFMTVSWDGPFYPICQGACGRHRLLTRAARMGAPTSGQAKACPTTVILELMLSEKLREYGVVGAGGAGFPTYVKAQSQGEFMIANGAECEPRIHKDAELMKHSAGEILAAVTSVMDSSGARR